LSTQIVGSIARITVPSVTPSTPVTHIALLMSQQNIGAVIVANDFEVFGIITERDIIERVALEKKDLYGVVAQDIMTAPVITIDYERRIDDALKIMKDNSIRRLVVVKGKKVLGLVTERRLLLANFAAQHSTINIAKKGKVKDA
jgi:CBS domain-containing protein